MLNMAMVFLGGGIGACTRFAFNKISNYLFSTTIHSTIFVNVVGCFLMGYIYFVCIKNYNVMPNHVKLFLTVGFLGALTTFSTFSNELFLFLKEGKIINFALYCVSSLFLGLIGVYFGHLLSKI